MIYDLPGVRFTSSPRLLADDKAFAPTVLPGIRKVVEADLTGKAGWRVITTDPSGAEVEELYAKAAGAGEGRDRHAERRRRRTRRRRRSAPSRRRR